MAVRDIQARMRQSKWLGNVIPPIVTFTISEQGQKPLQTVQKESYPHGKKPHRKILKPFKRRKGYNGGTMKTNSKGKEKNGD